MNEGKGFILRNSSIFRFFLQHFSSYCQEANCQELPTFSEVFYRVEAEAAILFQGKLSTIGAIKMQRSIFSDFDEGSYF